MINKIFSSKGMDSVEQAGQVGGNCGMEGCGVGMHGEGVQIAFRGDVWRWGCHGVAPIVSQAVAAARSEAPSTSTSRRPQFRLGVGFPGRTMTPVPRRV